MKHLLFLSILCSLVFFTNCGEDVVAVEKFTLTILISPSEGGSVAYENGFYEEGEKVTLVATANEYYGFKEWKGDFNGEINQFGAYQIVITMTANNTEVTAVFELKDTDGDGVTDDKDICPDTPIGLFPNIDGCSNFQVLQNMEIGDAYQGGILAYILEESDPGYIEGELHGLIISPSKQSEGIQWGCIGVSEPMFYLKNDIGSGAANTALIVAECGADTAADLCDKFEIDGYDDWFFTIKR